MGVVFAGEVASQRLFWALVLLRQLLEIVGVSGNQEMDMEFETGVPVQSTIVLSESGML